jgi:hypothetical protein
MIIRIFRVTVHPGKGDRFRTFFLETARPLTVAQ